MTFFHNKITLPIKEAFEYELGGIQREATIYRSGTNHKKIVLFLSGSYKLDYDIYIRKVISDLQTITAISENYEFIVFEKLNQSSIDIYDDVAIFLKTIDMEELVLFGFSSGGVIASHIMNRLNSLPIKRKIITYDTPWQVQDNVESFSSRWGYRIDILFFLIVHSIYLNHYNYENIREHLLTTSWFHGAEKMVSMIKAIHGYDDTEMYKVTGWNWDIPADLKVCNIYCNRDPFVNRTTHERFCRIHEDSCTFTIRNLEKNRIGHCTDMGYNTMYLQEVMTAFDM